MGQSKTYTIDTREIGVIYVDKYHDGSLEPRGRDDPGIRGGLMNVFKFSTEHILFW